MLVILVRSKLLNFTGDLKAANILVDNRYRAKVADFGFSQKKSLGGTGTPFWMAPELLREEASNSTASDVYSFGIIMYEMYSRKDPYEGEDPMEVLTLVVDKAVQKRPTPPLHCPAENQVLMRECLVDDPEARPSFDEIDMRLKRFDTRDIEQELDASASRPPSVSLFDIFPRHIAEALRDGRAIDPEHRECVTIFFSDIVDFTTISSTLAPQKVAELLDRLYSKFDSLSQKHDIFKVETIGDAYVSSLQCFLDCQGVHIFQLIFVLCLYRWPSPIW